MAKKSKRIRAALEKVEREKLYPLEEALNLLKELSSVKFDESVDVSVNLGVNARKSDQNVRGATVLPKGTGKSVRVAVFAEMAERCLACFGLVTLLTCPHQLGHKLSQREIMKMYVDNEKKTKEKKKIETITTKRKIYEKKRTE